MKSKHSTNDGMANARTQLPMDFNANAAQQFHSQTSFL